MRLVWLITSSGSFDSNCFVFFSDEFLHRLPVGIHGRMVIYNVPGDGLSSYLALSYILRDSDILPGMASQGKFCSLSGMACTSYAVNSFEPGILQGFHHLQPRNKFLCIHILKMFFLKAYSAAESSFTRKYLDLV